MHAGLPDTTCHQTLKKQVKLEKHQDIQSWHSSQIFAHSYDAHDAHVGTHSTMAGVNTHNCKLSMNCWIDLEMRAGRHLGILKRQVKWQWPHRASRHRVESGPDAGTHESLVYFSYMKDLMVFLTFFSCEGAERALLHFPPTFLRVFNAWNLNHR